MKILLNSLLLVVLACQSVPAVQDGGRVAATAQDAGANKGYAHIIVNDGKGELSVTLERDGSIAAQLDGQPVPPERLQREGDHLRVLDGSGDTLYELQVFSEHSLLGYPYPLGDKIRQHLFGGHGTTGQQWQGLSSVAATPRHVIGVVTTPVDGGLAAQLGLQPDTAVIIDEVTAGMPAEKAGLKPYDVITRIDGVGPVTRESLRERIAATEVGKLLKFSLVRGGQPQELEVAVAETTDDANSFPRVFLGDMGGSDNSVWDIASTYGDAVRDDAALEKAHAELDRARTNLQARLEELRAQQAKGGAEGEAASKAAEELQAALKSMTDAQESMQAHADDASPEVRFFNVGTDGNKGLLLRSQGGGMGGQRAYKVRTSAPGQADAAPAPVEATEARMADLEARIGQLDARVAELVKALESASKKP